MCDFNNSSTFCRLVLVKVHINPSVITQAAQSPAKLLDQGEAKANGGGVGYILQVSGEIIVGNTASLSPHPHPGMAQLGGPRAHPVSHLSPGVQLVVITR